MSFTERFHSRKFWFSVGLTVTSSVFVATKVASFSQWAAFNQWVLGLYVGSNVASKLNFKPGLSPEYRPFS